MFLPTFSLLLRYLLDVLLAIRGLALFNACCFMNSPLKRPMVDHTQSV